MDFGFSCDYPIYFNTFFVLVHFRFVLVSLCYSLYARYRMEPTSTSSSAASSIDGRSVGGGGNDGGFLNLGMFSGSGISGGQSNTTNQQQQHQQLQQLQQQQHQQQGGDLVTAGSSGGGYSLANGFGNILLDSSIGTSGSLTSFDLSDFPSLVGGGGNSAIGGSIPGAGSGLAAALRAQQQQQHQLIQQNNAANNGSKIAGGSGGNLYRLAMASTNGNFNMASEDFPALSGSSGQSGSSGLGSNSILNSSSLLSGTSNTPVQRTNANGDALYNGSMLDNTSSQLESGAGLLSGAGLSSLGGLRGLQQSSVNQNVSISRAPTSSTGTGAIGSSVMLVNSSGATTGSALSGDYGLLGLLSVIRMTDADRNVLALGSDLTLLGLNLGTTEQIYSTFSSPWTDGVATKEPHFQVSYSTLR